jgi:hypothetical protein
MQPDRRFNSADLIAVGLLLALTVLIYGQAVQGGFLQWDDPSWIVDNCTIRWATLQTILALFSPHAHQYYQPLTSLSWMLDTRLGGLDPFYFHLGNVVLYAAGVALAYAYLRLLAARTTTWDTGRIRLVAFASAAAFLVHPAHVESVVWATERKDMLALVFGLAFLCLHLLRLKHREQPFWRDARWWLMAVTLVAAILSKGYAAVLGILPLAWLALEWFARQRRAQIGEFIEALPFALLLGASTVFYAAINPALEKIQADFAAYSPGQRFWLFGRYVGDYVTALAWPSDLISQFVLEPQMLEAGVQSLLGFAAIILMLALVVFLIKRGQLFWLSLIALSAVYLAPGTGLFPLNWSARYLLFPALLPSAALGVLLAFALKPSRSRLVKAALVLAVSAPLLFWTAETLSRIPVWMNNRAFYLDSVRQHEAAPAIRLNAAIALFGDDPDSGWALLQPLLPQVDQSANPQLPLAAADYLAHFGETEKAYALLESSAKRFPGSAQIPTFAAKLAATLGRLDEADAWLRRQTPPADRDALCRFWTQSAKQALASPTGERFRDLMTHLHAHNCTDEWLIFSAVRLAQDSNSPQPILSALESGDWQPRSTDLRLETLEMAYRHAGQNERAQAARNERAAYLNAQAFQACWPDLK